MAMSAKRSIHTSEPLRSSLSGLGGKNYVQLAAAIDAPAEVQQQPPMKKKEIRRERRRKAKIERKKMLIREHLRSELELTKKSERLGHQTWLDMCKEIKITELRVELQNWEQKLETTMAKKDMRIETLLGELEQAEESHRRQFAKQVDLIDYLTGCYKSLLECHKILHEQQASELIEDFYNELNDGQRSNNNIQVRCENIMHTTALVTEHEMLSDFQIYQDRLDDCVNSKILQRYSLRDSIADKMRALRKQLLTYMASLRNPIIDKSKFEDIGMLMERQRHFVFEEHRLNDVEFFCNRQIAVLQRDLLGVEVNAQRQMNDLNLEMAYFVQIRKSIEKEMDVNRQFTFEQMKIFCSESYEIIKKYKKLQKYGELLLTLSAQCRKLESTSEKIVPWGDFPDFINNEVKDVDVIKLKSLPLVEHLDMSEQEIAHDENVMKHFRRRLYLADMQVLILKKEKSDLIAENAKYVDMIKSMSNAIDYNHLSEAISIQCLKEVALPPCPLPLKRQKSRKLKSN